jgi:peptidase, S24 family
MKTEYEKAVEWLNKKAEKAGGITNLGKTLGASATTFFRVLKGGSPPSADKLLDWVAQLGGRIVFPEDEMDGYEMIPKVTAQAGAGSSLITSDEVLGFYAFRSSFLNRVCIHPKSSVMLDVLGNSMEPVIRHKDTILVDQSEKTLKDGKIFLVGFGDELLVKRVQRTPRGWLLKSENKDYSDITVEGPDLESFRVYGRVRWFGRVV